MQVIRELLSNRVLLSGLIVWGTAQILKTWCAMVPLRKMYREGADIQEIAARYRDIR